MSRLRELYQNKIVPKLQKELGYSNPYQVPRLVKVVVNMGVGKAKKDKKELEEALDDLTKITGQKPVVTRARKSVSSFGISKGDQIGCKVTLRRERMDEFLDKLFKIVLPRVRNFQGLDPKGFDGSGNYSLGLEDQMVFPEIDPGKVGRLRGLEITIVTSAKGDKEGGLLLRELGCPLRGKR